MSGIVRRFGARVAERLLPQMSAAAGCAPGCEYIKAGANGQAYDTKCCWTVGCQYVCGRN